MQRCPGLFGVGHTEWVLIRLLALRMGGASLADLAVAWRGIDCDMAWPKACLISYHYYLCAEATCLGRRRLHMQCCCGMLLYSKIGCYL